MSRLSIRALGPLLITLNGNPVIGFESDKVRALLVYLAVESDQPHRREKLAGLLWPEFVERSARASLRNALANLRLVIGDQKAQPSFLLITRQTIQFNRHSDYELDIQSFTTLVEAKSGGHPEFGKLEEAVNLYKGSFMDGFSFPDSAPFEEWVLVTREYLQGLALQAQHLLAGFYQEKGDYEQALRLAQHQLAFDPYQEVAHQQMMWLLALNGQRNEALSHYEAYRQTLMADLTVEPLEGTQEMYARLLDGELPEPPVTTLILAREPREVGECPYRGLAAFREADSPYFYGREEFTKRLLQAVKEQSLVAVIVGSSGSGKSSTIYAGLLPKLRLDEYWLIADFRPGNRPFQSMAGALLPFLEAQPGETDRLMETAKLADALQQGDLSLYDLVKRIHEKYRGAKRLLLVVDQFEELYTLCPEAEQRWRFLDGLLTCADAGAERPNSPFLLLLTLRADFMGQALTHRPFADALQEGSLLLGPMNREELRSAIEKPAEQQGAAFETGLVARLLDDVGKEPGNLPLLEFALALLWERLDQGWMTHAAYEDIGLVEGALARYAEEVYTEIEESAQEKARWIFVQLVQPGSGTEDTRRVTTRAELGDNCVGLIQHLADKRLVVTGRDEAGNEIVEVVHEALITGWKRLRGWMDADRVFRIWQEGLRGAIYQWEDSAKDQGALLQGAPLTQAERWLDERGIDLSEVEKTYLQASIAERHNRQVAETERQAREAKLEQRTRRVLQMLAVVFLIAAVVGGWLAIRATNAEMEARSQTSILLASQAENELEGGYSDRAVLLALEALEKYPYTSQSEHALAQAVTYNRALQLLEGHEAAVTGLAWSPDGTKLASSGGQDNTIRVWNPTTGEISLIINLPEGISGNLKDTALSVAWSPDGKQLLTVTGDRFLYGSQDYDFILWDAVSGEQIRMWTTSNEAEPEEGTGFFVTPITNYSTAHTADFASGNGRLVTVAGDNTAIVWDAALITQVLTLSEHENDVNSIAWSPDETKILTASEDGTARIWDASTGDVLLILLGHGTPVNNASWSPGGNQIVTATDDGTARIWNVQSGEETLAIQVDEKTVWDVDWSPDGRQVVTANNDSSVRIWDATTGEEQETLRGHVDWVTDVSWSPSGGRLASASFDGTIRVWNSSPGTQLMVFPDVMVGWDPDWSPDGNRIALSMGEYSEKIMDGMVMILDAKTGENLLKMAEGWFFTAYAQFSASGGRILFSGADVPWPEGEENEKKVHIYDADTGKELHQLKAPEVTTFLRDMDWSPDGSQVAACDMPGGNVYVWDAHTGELMLDFAAHPDEWCITVAWSPDGEKLSSGGKDSTIKIWDATTGELLLTFTGHEPPTYIDDLNWSPDGDHLLSVSGNPDEGARDNTARIWDSATGDLELLIDGHAATVWWGDWSPNGTRIVTTSFDNTTRIWDAITGAELLTLSTPADWGVYAKWSPNGRRLITTGRNIPATVWRVWQSTEELIDYAYDCCVFRQLTVEERQIFGLEER